jgi:hypothetical protein
MANIYQIKQELLAIFDEIEENGGELTPELEEQLAITQDSFKDKVKDYTNVIKTLQNDIVDIKAEKARLNDLQKSKEKTIDRLKTILVEAIEMFGDTSKTGGKFVDYGTGKVTIRTTEAVEINEDAINRFTNRYITALRWYSDNNQLQESLVNPSELLNFANSTTQDEEDEDILKLQFSDLVNIKASINADIMLDELLQTEKGFNLAKALIEYGIFDVTAKADKVVIKKEAKENHTMPIYASLVQNKSVTIK